jgi:3,4-dihydroxy 2-butanone 4-phosphate synthase/GTP cyclohydrolase II
LIYLSSQESYAGIGVPANESSDSKKDESLPKMDPRVLGIGAQIIRSLGIQRMRTHVTQQRTLIGLAGFGLEVVDSVLIQTK